MYNVCLCMYVCIYLRTNIWLIYIYTCLHLYINIFQSELGCIRLLVSLREFWYIYLHAFRYEWLIFIHVCTYNAHVCGFECNPFWCMSVCVRACVCVAGTGRCIVSKQCNYCATNWTWQCYWFDSPGYPLLDKCQHEYMYMCVYVYIYILIFKNVYIYVCPYIYVYPCMYS